MMWLKPYIAYEERKYGNNAPWILQRFILGYDQIGLASYRYGCERLPDPVRSGASLSIRKI